MGESQSRYGIMEEMNQKKLATQKELVKLEEALEVNKLGHSDEQLTFDRKIEEENSTYKIEHQKKVQANRQEIVKIRHEQAEANRKFSERIAALEDDIEGMNESFETNHKNTVSSLKRQKTADVTKHERWENTQKRLIAAKQAEIKTIDGSIKELKALSKEQSK